MGTTSQREFWNGPPEQLRVFFDLRKPAKGAWARGTLWSHPLGWELRLEVNDSIIRTQLLREPGTIDDTAAEWEATMRTGGWA